MVDSLYLKLTRLLKAADCSKLREGKGSHEIWITPEGKRLIIPSNINNRMIANAVLKQAGLSKGF